MAVPDPHQRPSRTALVLLLLACFTLITLDARGGDDSPVEPVRSAVGDFFGPVESVTAAVVRPLAAVPEFFTTTGSLRSDVARLEAENAHLKGQLADQLGGPQPCRRARRPARRARAAPATRSCRPG